MAPDNLRLRHHLALTYMMDNKIDPAIAEIQTMIKSDDFESYLSKSVIHRLLGRCFMKKNMFELALKQFLLTGSFSRQTRGALQSRESLL